MLRRPDLDLVCQGEPPRHVNARKGCALKVRNIDGSPPSGCACGSWLKHWQKFSGQSLTYCPVAGCLDRDLAGVHVQIAADSDGQWFIYPLCQEHSQTPGELLVSDTFFLVSASKAHTCEGGLGFRGPATRALDSIALPPGGPHGPTRDPKNVVRVHPFQIPRPF